MKILQYVKSKNLNELIFIIVLSILIIDMGGGFGLKYISFALLGIYLFFINFKNKSFEFIVKSKFELIFFAVIPIILSIISVLFRNVLISNAVSAVTPFIVWIIYPLLLELDCKKIVRVFMQCVFYLSLVMIFTFFIILIFNILNMHSAVGLINEFSNQFSLGYIGYKHITDSLVIPDIFFKSVFLLIPAAVLWLNFDKYWKKGLVVICAAIMTTSTGVVLFTFLALIWSVVESKTGIRKKIANNIVLIKKIFKTNKRKVIACLCVLCLLVIFYVLDLGEIVTFVIGKFDVINNPSTSIKTLHVQSILQVMFENPINLFLGTGVGSEFYSLGAGAEVINVEVSHFNFARQFGLIYATIFFGYIFLLYKNLKKTDQLGNKLGIGLVCAFFAAGTNPLLISPVFFIVMIISRAYIEKYQRR